MWRGILRRSLGCSVGVGNRIIIWIIVVSVGYIYWVWWFVNYIVFIMWFGRFEWVFFLFFLRFLGWKKYVCINKRLVGKIVNVFCVCIGSYENNEWFERMRKVLCECIMVYKIFLKIEKIYNRVVG